MSRKIIGVTVGTPLSVKKIKEKINPVTTDELQAEVETALQEAKANGEFDGAPGQRGTGILNTTTGIASYTTTVNGIKPTYRILLSTLKTQSKVDEVLVGDMIRYSYFLYPVIYVDDTYAYMGTRVDIRGATGAAGKTPVKGTDYWTDADKQEMVTDVLAALPTWEGGSY